MILVFFAIFVNVNLCLRVIFWRSVIVWLSILIFVFLVKFVKAIATLFSVWILMYCILILDFSLV